MGELSLFNSADDCLAHFLDDDVFDESLLLNILFQEGVLVHEAYFFNSDLLAKHVQRAVGRPSLFEMAAQQGLIVPALRDVRSTNLDDAFERMKTVYGESYDLLRPRMQPVRDRVVASANAGIATGHVFYWPTSTVPLGVGYQNTMARLLQADTPPEYTSFDPDREQLVRRVWEVSKPWRFDCIAKAIELTKKKGAARVTKDRSVLRYRLVCRDTAGHRYNISA